jgi:DHA1 family tetracycline resistance protein-like MFS transporter
MSNVTPRDAQGELQTATSSLQSLSLLFAPVVMTQTLHYFSTADAVVRLPGAAFLLGALLTLFAFFPLTWGGRASRSG